MRGTNAVPLTASVLGPSKSAARAPHPHPLPWGERESLSLQHLAKLCGKLGRTTVKPAVVARKQDRLGAQALGQTERAVVCQLSLRLLADGRDYAAGAGLERNDVWLVARDVPDVAAEEELHVFLHHGHGLERFGGRLAFLGGWRAALDTDQDHEFLHRRPQALGCARVANVFHGSASLRGVWQQCRRRRLVSNHHVELLRVAQRELERNRGSAAAGEDACLGVSDFGQESVDVVRKYLHHPRVFYP